MNGKVEQPRTLSDGSEQLRIDMYRHRVEGDVDFY